MTVQASLSTDKDSYVHGETITVTYHVSGTQPLTDVAFSGVVTVNGVDTPVNASAKVGDKVAFGTPTAPGLTFAATANPLAFTAVA